MSLSDLLRLLLAATSVLSFVVVVVVIGPCRASLATDPAAAGNGASFLVQTGRAAYPLHAHRPLGLNPVIETMPVPNLTVTPSNGDDADLYACGVASPDGAAVYFPPWKTPGVGILRIDTVTRSTRFIHSWPDGFDIVPFAFIGAAHDGVDTLWMVPCDSNAFVRMSTSTFQMTKLPPWPGYDVDQAVGKKSYFNGAFIDQKRRRLWTAPRFAKRAMTVHVDTNAFAEPADLPQGYVAVDGGATPAMACAGVVSDGRLAWLIPVQSRRLVAFSLETLALVHNLDLVADLKYTPATPNAFNGAVWDSTAIVFIPDSTAGPLRFDPVSLRGTVIQSPTPTTENGLVYTTSDTRTDFLAGLFDGETRYLFPASANRIAAFDEFGDMKVLSSWPSGFTFDNVPVLSGVFDGTRIWMAPFRAATVVVISPSAGPATNVTGTIAQGGFSSGPAFGPAVTHRRRRRHFRWRPGRAYEVLLSSQDPSIRASIGPFNGRRLYAGGVIVNSTHIATIPDEASSIAIINTDHDTIERLVAFPQAYQRVPRKTLSLAVARGHLYLVPQQLGVFHRMSLADGHIDVIPFNLTNSGGSVYSVVDAFVGATIDHDGNVWMSNRGAPTPVVLETSDELVGHRFVPLPVAEAVQQSGIVQDVFIGCVFDGASVWMIPQRFQARLVFYDVATRQPHTVSQDLWPPTGFALQTTGRPPFSGGTFDGTHIWFAQFASKRCVRVHRETHIVDIVGEPFGGAVDPVFNGLTFDGISGVVFAPTRARPLITAAIDQAWSDVTLPSLFTPHGLATAAFSGATSAFPRGPGMDGKRRAWLLPGHAPHPVRIDPVPELPEGQVMLQTGESFAGPTNISVPFETFEASTIAAWSAFDSSRESGGDLDQPRLVIDGWLWVLRRDMSASFWIDVRGNNPQMNATTTTMHLQRTPFPAAATTKAVTPYTSSALDAETRTVWLSPAASNFISWFVAPPANATGDRRTIDIQTIKFTDTGSPSRMTGSVVIAHGHAWFPPNDFPKLIRVAARTRTMKQYANVPLKGATPQLSRSVFDGHFIWFLYRDDGDAIVQLDPTSVSFRRIPFTGLRAKYDSVSAAYVDPGYVYILPAGGTLGPLRFDTVSHRVAELLDWPSELPHAGSGAAFTAMRVAGYDGRSLWMVLQSSPTLYVARIDTHDNNRFYIAASYDTGNTGATKIIAPVPVMTCAGIFVVPTNDWSRLVHFRPPTNSSSSGVDRCAGDHVPTDGPAPTDATATRTVAAQPRAALTLSRTPVRAGLERTGFLRSRSGTITTRPGEGTSTLAIVDTSPATRTATVVRDAAPRHRITATFTATRPAADTPLTAADLRPPSSSDPGADGVAAATGLSPAQARAVVATAYGGSAVAVALSPASGSRATTAARTLTAAFACGDPEAASAAALEPDYVLVVWGPAIALGGDGSGEAGPAVGAVVATAVLQVALLGLAAWATASAHPALVGRWGAPQPGSGDGDTADNVVPAAAAVVMRPRDRVAGIGLGLAAAFYGPNVVELAAAVVASRGASVAERAVAAAGAGVVLGAAGLLARATWAPTSVAWVQGSTWVFGDGGVAGGFGRCAVRLFFFEDVLAAHAVAAAAGLMPLATSRAQCAGMAGAMVVAAAAHAAYLVWQRPYAAAVEQWTTVAVAVAQLVLAAAVAGTVASSTSSSNNDGDDDEGRWAAVGWLLVVVDVLVWGQLAVLTAHALCEGRGGKGTSSVEGGEAPLLVLDEPTTGPSHSAPPLSSPPQPHRDSLSAKPTTTPISNPLQAR